MAHTEKCRGCVYENRCDYITCQIQYIEEVRAKARAEAIDEFVERMKSKADWIERYSRAFGGTASLIREKVNEIAEQLKAGGKQ